RKLEEVPRLKRYSKRTAAAIGAVARCAIDLEAVWERGRPSDSGKAAVDALGDPEPILNSNDRSNLPTSDHVPYKRTLAFTQERYLPARAWDEGPGNVEWRTAAPALETELMEGRREARRKSPRGLIQVGGPGICKMR